MAETFLKEFSGSLFWLILTVISLLGLILLSLWSFHNEHLQAGIISMIFFFMIFSGIILAMFSGKKLYQLGEWGTCTVGFTIGFIFYYIIGGAKKSVLAITENSLFASVSSELPRGISEIMNSFVIPFSEELLWIIGIPYITVAIMDILGKKYKIFKNAWIQIIVIGLVSGLTFSIFHIGKLVLAFIIGALLFRLVITLLVVGDQKQNIVKYFLIPVAAAPGAHMGNNIAQTGLIKSFGIITEYNVFIGLILYGFLAIVFLSAINTVIEFIYDKING